MTKFVNAKSKQPLGKPVSQYLRGATIRNEDSPTGDVYMCTGNPSFPVVCLTGRNVGDLPPKENVTAFFVPAEVEAINE